MRLPTFLLLAASGLVLSCREGSGDRTMTLIDPGHFHASLIQKNMLEGVSGTVKVFAPEGEELQTYLAAIESFNSRAENPTCWKEEVHAGADYLEALPEAEKGDFVVLAGDNGKKADYLLAAVRKGYHVLSDKPLAIDGKGFSTLKEAYSLAEEKGLVIYDLMTERYDVLNLVSRELTGDKELFGAPVAVAMSSVHHFYKNVSGAVLKRPAWYYDVRRQGEGIADVTTHLVDQVFWQCFPGEAIGIQDVTLKEADHDPTAVTPEQYTASTGVAAFPDDLRDDVADGALQVLSNGSFSFEVKGVPVSIRVRWDYEAPAGSGDTSESLFKGTGATVRLVQDASTGFVRQLFLSAPEEAAGKAEKRLKKKYPYIDFKPSGEGSFLVDIPSGDRPGHEAHFNLVAKTFLAYLDGKDLPAWERTNTLTKYYLTTGAAELARKKNRGK